MAKDGTNRGGARVGSGRKPKALADKISKGSSAMVMELPEPPAFEGADVPPIKEYLKARQKNGKDLCAAEVYAETWKWLKERVGEPLDTVRGMYFRVWFPGKASHHRKCDCFPLCLHEPDVYETGQPDLVPDLPDRQGKLLGGV